MYEHVREGGRERERDTKDIKIRYKYEMGTCSTLSLEFGGKGNEFVTITLLMGESEITFILLSVNRPVIPR